MHQHLYYHVIVVVIGQTVDSQLHRNNLVKIELSVLKVRFTKIFNF